jgi:glucokinase
MDDPMPADQPIYALGLDVGATKIAGGIVDVGTGAIVRQERVPTLPQRGGEAVLADALELARRLTAEAPEAARNSAAIGIGVPELVDLSGSITSENSIKWLGLPVAERFAEFAPAFIEADVRAAAFAEARYGAGRSFAICLFITVGSGISCCLVLHGQPYAGARGNALIMASSPFTATCPNCGAVSNLVLEEFASGPALAARYNQARPGSAARSEEVLAAARDGEPQAVQIVSSAGEALGNSVGWLVNVMDPAAVVVGGGLGVAGGLYWDSFVRSTRRHIWSDTSRELPIVRAALGAEAGLIGAAGLAHARLHSR